MDTSEVERSLLEQNDLQEGYEKGYNLLLRSNLWAGNLPKRLLLWMCFLLPSWLRTRNNNLTGDVRVTKRPTLYLNGIRGLVAALVFIRHFSLPWQEHLDYGYGQYDSYYGLLRLPLLRVLIAGPLVPIFFVVSGYVLSAKPLKLGRSRAWQDLSMTMTNSVFRRAPRLFLPPLVSTFVVMLIIYLGGLRFNYAQMPGRVPVHPDALPSFRQQAAEWTNFAFLELTNPWTWQTRPMIYGPHLWTIPISFQGSLVVFLTTVGLARARPRARFVLLCLGIFWTEICGRWNMAPFLGGMLLCELDSYKSSDALRSKACTLSIRGLSIGVLVLGLYIGSFPRFNDHGNACVVGYQQLCKITPNYHYWHGVAAMVIMFAISFDRTLQLPLESRFIQYLGSISFSMYIVHEPFLHLAAFWAPSIFWSLMGRESMLGYQCGLALGMLLSGSGLVWIADVFKNLVEDPCGKLAGKLEALCFVDSNLP